MKKLIIFLSLIYTLPAFSQDILPDSAQASKDLPPVLIESSRVPVGKSNQNPYTTYAVNPSRIQTGQQQLSLVEPLAGIPGVIASNGENFAQDARISIRGFGARAPFGIRGIKLVMDGFIFSTPDGQGQVDNVDLGNVGSIQVLAGPSSGLYGNASGGVIDISTKDYQDSLRIAASGAVGAFGFQRYGVTFSQQRGKLNYMAYVSRTQQDGFREHSRFINNFAQAKLTYQVNPTHTVTLLTNYVNSPIAQDPGGINADAVAENRQQARDRNVDFDGGEALNQGMIGIKTRKIFRTDQELEARIQFTNRTFANKLPFEFGGIVEFNRLFTGGGITYKRKIERSRWVSRSQVGTDIAFQRDDRQRFRNLTGTKGDFTLDQIESFSNVGVYYLQQVSIKNKTQSEFFSLNYGLRYDYNDLRLEDRFLSDENQSGQLTFNTVNPSLGLNWRLTEGYHLYANFSTSFETPTLTELGANPDGTAGFNPDIRPQEAQNLEIGTRGLAYISNKLRLSYQVAFYQIELQNELVPFELADFPGRTFFRNAGESSRTGLEAILGVKIDRLSINLNYTYADYRYTNYETNGVILDGNRLPAIPLHQGFASIQYDSRYVNLQVWGQYFSSVFADDANEVLVEAYPLLNFRAEGKIDTRWGNLHPFLGINNLSNTEYNANLRINAFGGRYFEPASGIHLFGGIKWVWRK